MRLVEAAGLLNSSLSAAPLKTRTQRMKLANDGGCQVTTLMGGQAEHAVEDSVAD